MSETTQLGEPLLINGSTRVSASEHAYELLKRLIVRLELPPGAILNEGFLTERLNLGRTPLREALQRLAQEHLVVILPRRGIMISEISIGDLQAIFEVRADLEALCGRLAAQRITAEQITQLEELFEGIESTGDPEDDVEIDQRFHQIIMEATQNHHLQDMLSRLHFLSLRLLYLSKSRMARVRETYEDYRHVIDALRRHDSVAAERGLRDHADAFYQKVHQTLLRA